MREAVLRGLGFGLTSGIITTLGLIIGLNVGTGSRLAVIGGIVTVAFADAFSDAFGMHISQEASSDSSRRSVLQASFTTFFAKLIIASTFIVPFVLFSLSSAVIVSILWGFVLLVVFTFMLAKIKGERPARTIVYHLVIALVVVCITYLIGLLVRTFFS